MITATVGTVRKGMHHLRQHPTMALSVFLATIVCLQLVVPGSAFAGPGGLFVKAVAKTFWGKVALGAFTVIFSPLILYVLGREAFEVWRCKRDLGRLAPQLPIFEWRAMEARMQYAVRSMYTAWGDGDLSPAAGCLTAAYFQSQQDLLHRWADEGKKNVFVLHGKLRIAPLYIRVEDADSLSLVGVRLRASVTDYMLDHAGTMIKGERGRTTLENVVYFVHCDGAWLLHSIEAGSQTLAVASMKNKLDATYLLGMADASELSGADSAQHPRSTHDKGEAVGVAQDHDSEGDRGDVAQR